MALAAHPDSQSARFHLSLQDLASGDFAAGWRGYEARWYRPEFRNTRPDRLQPQWRGEDIRGSRILIYREQGLGDTLQFARYIPKHAVLGARVVLRVQPPLVRLLSSIQSDAITVVSAESDEGSDAEWQCPLMSLPRHSTPISQPSPAMCRISSPTPPIPPRGRGGFQPTGCASAWSGRAIQSIPAIASAPSRWTSWPDSTRLPGVTFYSLQKGPAAQELAASSLPIVDLAGQVEDFADTAAIVANLDLVICVDTAVAHLAGAMGKPVWFPGAAR